MIYNIKERGEGFGRIRTGLGLVLGIGLAVLNGNAVAGSNIVLNGAEMAIYSIYCSRNLGCLCDADRRLPPPGSDCYVPLEPIG